MTRPLVQIVLLTLVSITGIAGMLLAEDRWDWAFFALAALPLLIAGGLTLSRHIRIRSGSTTRTRAS